MDPICLMLKTALFSLSAIDTFDARCAFDCSFLH
jgi:hypothetical protein